ncbi:MAG: multiheme c-type cytochrome [Desulfovibrionaceae bacterium]
MKLVLGGISAVVVCLALILVWAKPGITDSATFVGSKACADCHELEYENFSKYAKKSKSAHSLKIMASDLTEEELKECFHCHTTGYGQPGGFVSFEKTPELADAGCEVCHGPGSIHVEYGDPEFIKGDLDMQDCVTCHNEERVRNFDFKPLLYGGAH